MFRELKQRRNNKELWRNIDDKERRFYIPMLYAFKDELLKLYEIDHHRVSSRLVSYLLGKYDFYKIIKENVSIQSFNIFGSLEWGNKIPLPKRIGEAELKENSHTTLIVIFDNGWQISFLNTQCEQ